LAKISIEVLGLWLISPIIGAIRRGKNVYVDGKRLPPDETAARKAIMDTVEAEQQKKEGGQ